MFPWLYLPSLELLLVKLFLEIEYLKLGAATLSAYISFYFLSTTVSPGLPAKSATAREWFNLDEIFYYLGTETASKQIPSWKIFYWTNIEGCLKIISPCCLFSFQISERLLFLREAFVIASRGAMEVKMFSLQQYISKIVAELTQY